MAQYRTTIEVPATPDEALAFVADFANAPKWDPAIVEAERVPVDEIGEPPREGTRFRVVVAFFGRRIELTTVLEEYEPGRRAVLASSGKSVRSRDTITVAATDTGTALTYDAELRLTGAMRLLDKGLQLSFTTMSEKATAGLKKALGG